MFANEIPATPPQHASFTAQNSIVTRGRSADRAQCPLAKPTVSAPRASPHHISPNATPRGPWPQALPRWPPRVLSVCRLQNRKAAACRPAPTAVLRSRSPHPPASPRAKAGGQHRRPATQSRPPAVLEKPKLPSPVPPMAAIARAHQPQCPADLMRGAPRARASSCHMLTRRAATWGNEREGPAPTSNTCRVRMRSHTGPSPRATSSTECRAGFTATLRLSPPPPPLDPFPRSTPRLQPAGTTVAAVRVLTTSRKSPTDSARRQATVPRHHCAWGQPRQK